MRKLDYIELGGTLFSPATKKNLLEILQRKKYPTLKSILIDLEDGLGERSYEMGKEALQTLLEKFQPNDLLVFVRPKNPASLQEILAMKNSEKIDGFVLPKFSLKNFAQYFSHVEKTPYYLMPSIEDKELFSEAQLQQLREKLLPYKEQILTLRIGCEDMLRQLQIQRKAKKTLFDLHVTTHILATVVKVFKPYGFNISGCVYPYFQDVEGFIADAAKELEEGFFSKTIIHPNQIEPLNELYKITQQEQQNAQELLYSLDAVFNQNGKMAEVTTQAPFAKFLLRRADVYGIRY
jgi:citrate lyase beta subunit